jgi:hypothetical protein
VLEISDVIATKHRPPQIQHPIAETVTGADEGHPGPGVADPVSGKVALFLEARYRCNG